MTEEEALRRALKQEVADEAVLRPLRLGILLDPADDLARLAYADALEELGRTAEASRIRARLASPEVCEEAEACGVRTVESRGFVRSASCTLEAFLREAGRLFAYCPITEVTLTGKYPLDNSGVEGYFGGDPHSPATSWFWIPQATPGVSWEVPIEFRMGWANNYATPEAALDALSLRAVNYGRRLAGLPPLPPRP